MARRAAPHRGVDVHYGEPLAFDEDGEPTRPSKTRLKQQSQELQTLGVAVAELSNERLAAIDMPESLRDAIEQFRRTKSFEGRRRQMQYVGKLMRSADEEALREAVAAAWSPALPSRKPRLGGAGIGTRDGRCGRVCERPAWLERRFKCATASWQLAAACADPNDDAKAAEDDAHRQA